MIHIKKKKAGKIGNNRGVRISIDYKKNIVTGFFNSEFSHSVPEYFEFGVDNDRFYFIPSNVHDGYLVRKVGYCARVSFSVGENLIKIIEKFKGNNKIHFDKTGFYIVAGDAQ